jgi:endonuclease YncB( thermonuclease family)
MRVSPRVGWLLGSVLASGCPAEVPVAADGAPPIPTRAQLAAVAAPLACTLDRWEDGDTPYVRCGGAASEAEPVRLIGIDTAESGFDENSERRAHWQAELWGLSYDDIVACGKAATERANRLCPGGQAVEVVGHERDKYERRLGYVVCAGVEINGRLVEEGLAGRYPYPAPPRRPGACRPGGTREPGEPGEPLVSHK